ncbi:MAG: M24 family metallopeptidase, partial [Candidatus Fimadaptatus sp.]
DRARPLMKLGMSGKDIQRLFQRLALEAGVGFSWDSCYDPYVSVGARSSYNCKMPPDDVYVQPGDVINVDFGVRTFGFASDNQRTFYAAGAERHVPDEVQHAFDTLKLINARVAEAMKVGADSNALGRIGIDTMAEQGYAGQIRSYGHEIGIYAHNGGIGAGMHAANAGQNTTLVENMTFTLEPAIITSRGRVCREDVVCVGPQRGRILGRQQDEIWLITE